MLHNLLFKAIFGQDYPNLGRDYATCYKNPNIFNV